jgi:hypothetical protein
VTGSAIWPGQPASTLAAQAGALASAATFITQAGMTGLTIAVSGEQITILVPPHAHPRRPPQRGHRPGRHHRRARPGLHHHRHLDPDQRRWDHQRPPGPRLGQHRAGGHGRMTVTVTDRTGLTAALRQLKLSGMLATLDARLTQAAAGELGHLDFLQVLCEDEISRR